MHCSAENGLKNTDTSSGKIWGKMPRKKWGPERQCMATSSEADPTEIASTAPWYWTIKTKCTILDLWTHFLGLFGLIPIVPQKKKSPWKRWKIPNNCPLNSFGNLKEKPTNLGVHLYGKNISNQQNSKKETLEEQTRKLSNYRCSVGSGFPFRPEDAPSPFQYSLIHGQEELGSNWLKRKREHQWLLPAAMRRCFLNRIL